jgi:anti-sigma B factor antagonist
MKIETRTSGDAVIVEVKDRRVEARDASELKEKIAALIAGGNENIVLDLSEVEVIDSSGLGAIVASFKLLGGTGQFAIAGARGTVQSMFKLTRVDQVIRFVTTADQALGA